MDLRKEKTESALKASFLRLRAQAPVERITVRSLCEDARVGKATFYLHYHDVYDLSATMQREVIADILDAIPHPEKMFNEPDRFTRDFTNALWARKSLIDILFSGSQAALLGEAICKGIEGRAPNLDDPGAKVRLDYMVYGAFHAYQANVNEFGHDELLEQLIYMGEKFHGE